VAGVCHHVIEKVAWGENVASSKHQHEPDFLRNITIQKIKGWLLRFVQFLIRKRRDKVFHFSCC